ncbi:hypothetical protein ABZX30_28475 [Streptomyces sp. NPDC004542]|uniref:hypothetical protein n=1 Tax=Streptomyces sp. NPDC004542 TaxID=3154281 RepID=UPI0033B3AB22
MTSQMRRRVPGTALLLAVLGMLIAALPNNPAAAAPNPPPRPMTAANPGAFTLQWGNDRRAQARSLRRAVNPLNSSGTHRVTVGSMLDAADHRARTQSDPNCASNATSAAHNGALRGAHATEFYCLNSVDTVTNRWTPQGVSGTEDARAAGTVDNHHAIVFSWHHSGSNQHGTRLSFLDRATNRYINVLLVEPDPAGTDYSEVDTHAGGIVWYQNYIFVAGPQSGVRVFDTTNLLRLSNNPKGNISPTCQTGLRNGRYCGRGYHYLLPEIGQWINRAPATRYDSMSLERAPGRTDFLTSEYRENSVGRVARWTNTSMISFQGVIHPYRAWHQPVRYVQGAFSRGCYYFDMGGGFSGNRYLVWANATGNTTPRWQRGGRGLQDLYWLRSANQLWTLTEHPGIYSRFLYGVHRPACP